jgi:hypothetical protein
VRACLLVWLRACLPAPVLVDDCVRVRACALVCSIVCELVRSRTRTHAPARARASFVARARVNVCTCTRVCACVNACLCERHYARVSVCVRAGLYTSACADVWMHLYACCLWPMADSREASRRRGALKARPLRALATRTVAS